MVKSCCAIKCSNKYVRGSTITFHRFPLGNKQLLKKWVVNIRRQNFRPTRFHVICSEHFADEDFKRKLVASGKRRKLKPEAVPTIFNFPERLQKHTKPRRPLIRHVLPDRSPCGTAKTNNGATADCSPCGSVEAAGEKYSKGYVIDHEHSYSLPRSPKEIATKLNHIIARQSNYIKILKAKLYYATRKNGRQSTLNWCNDITEIASVESVF